MLNVNLNCPYINQDTHFVVNEKDDIIDDIYSYGQKFTCTCISHEHVYHASFQFQ